MATLGELVQISKQNPTINNTPSRTDNAKSATDALARILEKPTDTAPIASTAKPTSGTSAHFRWVAESMPSADHPTVNEDAWFVITETGAAGVLDGTRSVSQSAQASQQTSQALENELRKPRNSGANDQAKPLTDESTSGVRAKQLGTFLLDAHKTLQTTNAKKVELATTATILEVNPGVEGKRELVFASVGDSRISVWRKATNMYELLLFDDHLLRLLMYPPKERPRWVAPLLTKNNLAADLVLAPEKAAYMGAILDQATDPRTVDPLAKFLFEERAIVTQSLGHMEVTPHTGTTTLQSGDRVLLATDGLHDNLTEGEIRGMLAKTSFDQVASALVVRADEVSQSEEARAKKDDITAIVMEML